MVWTWTPTARLCTTAAGTGVFNSISAPVTIYLYGSWVAQFSRRALWWPWIVVAGLAVVVVSFLAVALQTWNAVRQNPSDCLKQE